MKWSAVVVIAVCAGAVLSPFARAADAPPPLPAAPPASPSALPLDAEDPTPRKAVSEPAIKRTVIEDRSARIEELRVRGQLQKVTVSPKGGVPGYEVLLGDGAHVIGDDPGTSRGSAGKRVWNVLRF
jgi:hypothetical protein